MAINEVDCNYDYLRYGFVQLEISVFLEVLFA